MHLIKGQVHHLTPKKKSEQELSLDKFKEKRKKKMLSKRYSAQDIEMIQS